MQLKRNCRYLYIIIINTIWQAASIWFKIMEPLKLNHMERIFICLTIASLTLISCSSRSEIPAGLTGDWYTVKGDVEVYSFTTENGKGIYLGTIDDRPMVKGTWKVEKGMLVLIPDSEGYASGSSRYSYRISNDTLWLNEGQEIYTKTAPLKYIHPEASILENIRSDFNSLFTEPAEAEFIWPDGTYHGFAIETRSDSLSGLFSGLIQYIQDKGFEPDEKAVSEICNGYKKLYGNDTVIAMICYVQDEEGSPAGLKISAALKK